MNNRRNAANQRQRLPKRSEKNRRSKIVAMVKEKQEKNKKEQAKNKEDKAAVGDTNKTIEIYKTKDNSNSKKVPNN